MRPCHRLLADACGASAARQSLPAAGASGDGPAPAAKQHPDAGGYPCAAGTTGDSWRRAGRRSRRGARARARRRRWHRSCRRSTRGAPLHPDARGPHRVRFHAIPVLYRQRELGRDFRSFPEALRSALREMPDILLVGEIRDHETMTTALAAAGTGMLVLGTLHARCGRGGAAHRGFYPQEQQSIVRAQVADVFCAMACAGAPARAQAAACRSWRSCCVSRLSPA